MSSLTRRIQQTGAKIGVHNEAAETTSKRRGSRRGTNKQPKGHIISKVGRILPLTGAAMQPQPKATRGGRKGSPCKPSPALPEGQTSFRYFPLTENDDPAYRKSIWPAAKIEARR